ncbi:MAG: hypothetical protein PVH19_06675 [Planctomycetia bacterium]|jgi:hypothetical protein
MIRHPSRTAELGLDSLNDTMTNMMGLLLLMVAITVVRSGGMKITLHHQLEDPGKRTPIYLVCKDNKVFLMHRGNEWLKELDRVCKDVESRLERLPTTSEVLLEANLVGTQQSPDMKSHFVREIAPINGQEVYLIGIRFYPNDEPSNLSSHSEDKPSSATFTPNVLDALANADPSHEYVDAFVYETEFDTLDALQRKAAEHKLALGWRILHENQHPGLSETGIRGAVGGN